MNTILRKHYQIHMADKLKYFFKYKGKGRINCVVITFLTVNELNSSRIMAVTF